MKKQLKVAFPFIGSTVGGSHISTMLLMSALQAEGHEPIAILHQDGPLLSALEARRIPYILLSSNYVTTGGGIKFIFEIAVSILSLSRFLKKHQFDLVHANDGRMISSWIPAAKCAGVASIAHRRTKWVPSRLSDWCHGLADKIVVISDYVRQSAPKGLQEQIVVVLNPFERPIQVSKCSSIDEPSFLFVGTLQTQKRPLEFIQCAALVCKELPAANFHMVGRSETALPMITALIEQFGLSDCFTLHGFQENMQVHYDKATILLAPAVDEGHGRSLVEAMFNRVLVIAADSGGHKEIITPGQNGFLSPEGDVRNMAKLSIEAIQNTPMREQLVNAACNEVTERFSVNTHCHEMLRVYRETIE